MKTIDEVLNSKSTGLYYGNRIILPFTAFFIEVIIERDIITDFSSSSKGILVETNNGCTDLYFLEYENLKESISKYENIKLLVVEIGKDVFNQRNHRKLALYLKENHIVEIEELDNDILFVD